LLRPSRGADRRSSEVALFEAFQGEPLYETRDTALHYAKLYGWLLSRPDLVIVFVNHDGELAGFAYGHLWRWAEQADDWSVELRERLAEAAASLEGRFAVYLLAVHPDYRRHGMGRRLLRRLLHAAGTERAWLIRRDEPTPAMALYEAEGWKPIGHGPDTPNGRPGLVLIRD
jgi:ribosomal protein S18 acetylase RimI-like enzyme